MTIAGGSPLSQTGQQTASLPFGPPLGSLPAPPPMYYMQPPQMYYPPSAYAYPGGLVMNAPPKEQIEDAVRKQVSSFLHRCYSSCSIYSNMVSPKSFNTACCTYLTLRRTSQAQIVSMLADSEYNLYIEIFAFTTSKWTLCRWNTTSAYRIFVETCSCAPRWLRAAGYQSQSSQASTECECSPQTWQ